MFLEYTILVFSLNEGLREGAGPRGLPGLAPYTHA